MKLEAVHRAGQLAKGWLGDHTASIDWCEDNYAISMYIAEFWNTLSNIPFMLLGCYGIFRSFSTSTRNYPPGSATKPQDVALPHASRYALLHGSIAAIGFGSFIFHSTLKWHAQVMLDELPMVFAAALGLYCIVVKDGPAVSRTSKLALKIGLTLLPIAVSAAYLSYPDPLLHQVCYASIMITTVIYTQALYRSPRLSPEMVKTAKSLNWNGTLIFLAGFGIWNLDNIFCNEITAWRNRQPEWLAFLSQGHAWWHILTGLGASRISMGTTYLTLSIRYPDEIEVVGLSGLLPYVRRLPPSLRPSARKVDSHSNGNGVLSNGKVVNGTIANGVHSNGTYANGTVSKKSD